MIGIAGGDSPAEVSLDNQPDYKFFKATMSVTPVSFQIFERSSDAIASIGSSGL